jgi:hypothetical protein
VGWVLFFGWFAFAVLVVQVVTDNCVCLFGFEGKKRTPQKITETKKPSQTLQHPSNNI